jgi:hypothetical protein
MNRYFRGSTRVTSFPSAFTAIGRASGVPPASSVTV